MLLTDFCEGADPRVLYAAAKRLREAGVKLLGLAALDAQANAFYDDKVAGALASLGMEIAALTPLEPASLAGWRHVRLTSARRGSASSRWVLEC